jgi:hypothetical protein
LEHRIPPGLEFLSKIPRTGDIYSLEVAGIEINHSVFIYLSPIGILKAIFDQNILDIDIEIV